MTDLSALGVVGTPTQRRMGGEPIPPQAVPTMIAVGQVELGDGTISMVLIAHTPVTPNGAFYFMDGDQAETVGKTLLALAGPTKAGIMMAPQGQVPS